MAGGTGLSKQRKTPGKLDNRLRIISGRWRGRKLDFPDIEGLRPTPDRVRETLFNWLQDDIVGARCLDLFAGSGALGLEALSRGAAQALLVDRDMQVVNQLREHIKTLSASGAEIRQADAIQLLAHAPEGKPFNLVFLDPPYGRGLIDPCIKYLAAHHWLAEHALIYIEVESEQKILDLPESWEIIRDKTSGQVRYCLIRV